VVPCFNGRMLFQLQQQLYLPARRPCTALGLSLLLLDLAYAIYFGFSLLEQSSMWMWSHNTSLLLCGCTCLQMLC
jgi:hypothetical protein